MRKTASLTALAVLCLGLFSYSNKTEPAMPKVSIFCDHIRTIARQEGISFAEAAAKIKEIGYAGADVRVLQDPGEIKTLDSLGFEHSCAIVDIDYSKEDQSSLEYKTVAFMKEFGYDKLLLVAGFIPKEGMSDEQLEIVRQRIAAFAAKGAENGFAVMVEDYDNSHSFTYNSARIDSLFAVSKDLGLVFDTGNFLIAGEEALALVDHFSYKVGHVHLKDRLSPSDMKCVPVGTGCIPIAEIIRKLVTDGYHGWLTVEQFGSRNMLSDSEVSFLNVRAALDKENKSK